MSEKSTTQSSNAELRLSWDMAHAEAPLHNEIYSMKKNSEETSRWYKVGGKGSWIAHHNYTTSGDYHENRTWEWSTRLHSATIPEIIVLAEEKSAEVEKLYNEKLASQDEDYIAIEALYEGITINKEDLFTFLSGRTRDANELKVADQLTTRIWNMLGKVSSEANSDILFGVTQPSRKKKPGYMYGRNLVGSEIVEYKDLNLASLIHFLDTVQELSENGQSIRGFGAASLKAMSDFADYETDDVVNSHRKKLLVNQ